MQVVYCPKCKYTSFESRERFLRLNNGDAFLLIHAHTHCSSGCNGPLRDNIKQATLYCSFANYSSNEGIIKFLLEKEVQLKVVEVQFEQQDPFLWL